MRAVQAEEAGGDVYRRSLQRSPVLLARTNFYDESGVFRRPLCEAYVRGLRKRQERDRADRLRKMIKGLGGDTCSGLRLAAIEAALVDA